MSASLRQIITSGCYYIRVYLSTDSAGLRCESASSSLPSDVIHQTFLQTLGKAVTVQIPFIHARKNAHAPAPPKKSATPQQIASSVADSFPWRHATFYPQRPRPRRSWSPGKRCGVAANLGGASRAHFEGGLNSQKWPPMAATMCSGFR